MSELLAGVYLLTPSESAPRLWGLDPETRALVEVAAPDALAPLVAAWSDPVSRRLRSRDRARRDEPTTGEPSVGEPPAGGPAPDERPPARRLIAPDVPAIIVPYFGPAPGDAGSRARPSADRRTRDRSVPSSERTPPEARPLLIVHLDREVLVDTWLPALAERHVGQAPEVQLRVVTTDGADGSAPPIFVTGPDVPRGAVVDASAPLFGPLRFGEPRRRDPRGRRLIHALAALAGLDRGTWRLEAVYPAGSLDASLDRARRRSLWVVFGILGVLAAAVIQLSASARRSRELARRQLDFVAGVTHELRTPLTALRSAGQNLADGVVADPNQVQRYGQLVDREAGRLADLVDQVLAFARMQSTAPTFDLEPVVVADAVAGVVESHGPALDAEGIALDIDLDDDLPPVRADREILARILGNPVSNAAKYGQPADGERWIGLGGRRVGSGSVELAVRDRGPGIESIDRPRLFEPFVRGSELAASAIPGSGLGLALVRRWTEALGGRVDLAATPGGGATFTVTLPIAVTIADGEP